MRDRIPAMPASETASSARDVDLVRAIAEGREDALVELYERHAPLILGLARRILFHREDAEEVVQEVFTHVWRQAGSYEPARASVATWMVLIARSRAIDRLRSGRALDRAVAAAESDRLAPHTSPEGVRAVLSSERRRRVREELARLPTEQREALGMAFFGGMTQSEIAAATGIPLGTVKTRTLLAMKKLRAALRDEVRELL
jgi:RNA polymerase sigma-70 factor (ECF subfamily)